MKKFFSKEFPAWIFLAVCVVTFFIMSNARKPKIVKDTAGLLSSTVEDRVKSIINHGKSIMMVQG